MTTPFLRRALDLLLGAERKQRIRVRHLLMTGLVYGLCIAINAYAVSQGMAVRSSAVYLQSAIAFGVVLFYIMLRSGFSLRFKDPSMALAQSVYAFSAILLSYATIGPARGAVLMLLPLVFVFGMLALKPRETATLGFGTVAVLGILILAMSHFDPQRFNPQLERIHFGLSAIILLTLSWVAQQITELRARLKSQKLELADALVRVQELAIRDELTGLFNRRHMQTLLDEQHRLHARTRQRFCFAIIDIDHFKRVNDSFGHHVGDEVLQGFAKQARLALRDTDVIGRWGGEEFVLLFPDTVLDDALTGIERLRSSLNQHALSAAMPAGSVTFSAGVTDYSSDENPERMIERADQAMYEAKAAGRNRTVMSTAHNTQNYPPPME